jgi:MarR family transcriptional regulator, organic hydroperoxide resistance regulator
VDSRKPVSSCTPIDFDTLCQFWADTFGIIGPEWMIIFVLAEAGQGAELPEEIISQELNVHPSFVTTHSKRLEKLGFVGRRSAVGSKGVTLSLTALTRSRLQGLPSRKEA